MTTPLNKIAGVGQGLLSGRGIGGLFPVAGLNSVLQQQPSILLAAILPITNVINFRIVKSKQTLKYRSFEGVFLAHQQGKKNDDVAIQIVCKFIGPDRWWKIVLLESLYRYGNQPTSAPEGSPPSRESSGLQSPSYRGKGTATSAGNSGKTRKLKQVFQEQVGRSFPLISKYLMLPRCIIETYSYVVNANEKDTFDIRILIRPWIPAPKAPGMAEVGSRKGWGRVSGFIKDQWADMFEYGALMKSAYERMGFEIMNQRLITVGNLYLIRATPKVESNRKQSNFTLNPSYVGDDDEEIEIHSIDNIKSDVGTPILTTDIRTGRPYITIDKSVEELTDWFEVSGSPKTFPSIPWKFELDLTNETDAENPYTCILSFHENWIYDMYGDLTMTQYFTLIVTDTSEETIYLSTKVHPGLAYTINDDVQICFTQLDATQYITDNKFYMRCYANVKI